MRFFDFETMACQAGIADDRLHELCNVIRDEFPQDEMMYELHVLRACMAIRDGHASLNDWMSAQPA
jgi:hypothetical protein